MSLVNLILSQKIIPITVGLALLLITAALLLNIIPRVRRSRIRAAKRRAEEARLAAVAAEAVEDDLETDSASAPAKGKAERSSTPAPAKPATPAAAPKVPAPAAAPAAPAAEVTPSSMGDLLSSVFSDGGNSERQTALMRGLSDVDMTDVLTLSKQVALLLHGGKTVRVVTSKELE